MMEELEPTQALDQEEIVIEKEWSRIDRLMGFKHHLAWNMAIIEADKLFREVLGIVSFGDTVSEAIQNVADRFSQLKDLLEARKVYEDIVEVPGFVADKSVAEHAVSVYLQSILDLMGRDYQPKSSWHRFINEWIYFGEAHPKLLRGVLMGLLVFLVGVWFLADTTPGQWLVNLAVGFTHFILNWLWWLVLLVILMMVIVGISWLIFERRQR